MRILFFLWIVQGFAAFNLTWGTPAVSLDSNPPIGDTDGSPVIAIDSMGNGISVWGRTSDQKAIEDIWASTYNHSLRVWSGAVKISGGGNASNSRVAIFPDGSALFVWEEGIPAQILSRCLTPNGVWTPPLSAPPTAAQSSIYAQTSPQLKTDLEGNALLIWMEDVDGIRQIHSARKKNNSSWTSLGRISAGIDNTLLSLTKPLSLNPSGNGMAVWEQAGGIYGASYRGREWAAPILISSYGETPAVAVDESGDGIVVWHQAGVIHSAIAHNGHISQYFRATDPAYRSIHPDLAVDHKGNGVLVFERYNSLHKFIAATTLEKGSSSWTPQIDISAPSPVDAEAAGYPVLILNEIGDGVAIWKEVSENNRVIQGAGYSLGTWSLTKTLSSLEDNSGSSIPGYDISVAMNLAGNIIAVWPEDPSHAESFQLKANATSLKTTVGTGLANLGPPPPLPEPEMIIEGIASGRQIRHKFPAHSDLINILTWSSSIESLEYKIYRGSLSSLIGTSKVAYFEDHQRVPKKQETYLITSIDKHGQESSPMTLVVTP